jgi:hypothetical protein
MWGFLYLEFLWYNCTVGLNFSAIIMIAGRFKRPLLFSNVWGAKIIPHKLRAVQLYLTIRSIGFYNEETWESWDNWIIIDT